MKIKTIKNWVLLLLAVGSVSANDAFIDSCLNRYLEMANSIKSLSADMVVSSSLQGTGEGQKSSFFYLQSDMEYAKNTMNVMGKEMVYVFRGDDLYFKAEGSSWNKNTVACGASSFNPLKGTFQSLSNLAFQSEGTSPEGFKVYVVSKWYPRSFRFQWLGHGFTPRFAYIHRCSA